MAPVGCSEGRGGGERRDALAAFEQPKDAAIARQSDGAE
jgi:hypothetical protein